MPNSCDDFDHKPFHVAVLFLNFGGYHLARLNGASRACREAGWDLTGVQITDAEFGHPWGQLSKSDCPPVVTLLARNDEARSVQGPKFAAESGRALCRWLDSARPNAVLIPGWSLHAALSGLRWCLENRAVPILMSESKQDDADRHWWSEVLKAYIIGNFASALVGGLRHKNYLQKLRFPANAVFLGYDVVDNDYFAKNSDKARSNATSERRRLGLPENYFLASSRFIAKKNLLGLLGAYAKYREDCSNVPWDLIILGDGEQRQLVKARVSELRLDTCVHIAGFIGYTDLPCYYGLASAFVHASTTEQWGLVVNEAMASQIPVLVSETCGCAKDLVTPGVNGFIFSPFDRSGIASALRNVADLSEQDRAAMGRAAQNAISRWGPDAFGLGLVQSVNFGRATTLRPLSFFRKLILSFSTNRLGTGNSE